MSLTEHDLAIQSMVGKTFTEVTAGDDTMTFIADDGTKYEFWHSQSCCESVSIEDIIGDLSDLVGSPMLQAEEVSNADTPESYDDTDRNALSDSYTWTFYKFATNKGSVTVRWLGSSNGCYSESVDLSVNGEQQSKWS